jgi:hypothetical protein
MSIGHWSVRRVFVDFPFRLHHPFDDGLAQLLNLPVMAIRIIRPVTVFQLKLVDAHELFSLLKIYSDPYLTVPDKNNF